MCLVDTRAPPCCKLLQLECDKLHMAGGTLASLDSSCSRGTRKHDGSQETSVPLAISMCLRTLKVSMAHHACTDTVHKSTH